MTKLFFSAAAIAFVMSASAAESKSIRDECYLEPASGQYIYKGINCFTGRPMSDHEDKVNFTASPRTNTNDDIGDNNGGGDVGGNNGGGNNGGGNNGGGNNGGGNNGG
ncbi:MAG: hypothetical protein JKY99_08965, partial [Rhizobiales bacterium]|nr:hypothetical protein [Hyphomicrobiales bacterium]